MSQPLSQLRVVELSEGRGDMCGRILADLGAVVLRIRDARTQSDFTETLSDLTFQASNANKRVVTLDLGSPEDRTLLLSLLGHADVFIESLAPGRCAELGLDPATLWSTNPRLVVTSISDFGQDGPYRDWAATDWTHMALNSVLSRSGLPNQPPLMPPGSLASQTAAAQAAWATLVGFWHASQTGRGQHIDLSILEASLQSMDAPFGMGGSATGGTPAGDLPPGRPDARHMYPIFPCADGFVRICVLSKRQWRGMFKWLGEPEEFSDAKYDAMFVRFANASTLHPLIGKLFAAKTRAEIVQQGQEYGVPTETVQSASEVLATPHFVERGAFIEVELVPGVKATLPNGCVEIDGRRQGIRHLASPIDVDGVIREWSEHGDGDESYSEDVRNDGPLSGLRVLDMGVIVAGAEIGRLFADLGADVIKVENRAFPDGARQTRLDVEMTASFAWGHRNKRSFGVDLRHDEGKAIFLQLVAKSDVVMSNFKPGTLASLGLGEETLFEANPELVTVESSSLGSSGPWSGRMGYGPLVRAVTGLTQAWRYPEQPEGFCDSITIYPDHTSARVGAIAVLACLLRRRSDHRGATIRIAQSEVMFTQFSSEFLRESIDPGTFVARGNVGETNAPYGVFPCAGDDQWCVVTVRDDEEWVRLCEAIGAPELAEGALATSAGRVTRRDVVDSAVTAWTTKLSPSEVMNQLQRVGVPAGAMNRVNDLLKDPHLVARAYFQTLHQPQVGDIPTEGAPAVFSGSRDVRLRPAPNQAEHTRELSVEILALDEATFLDLVERGVLEESLPFRAPTN